MLVAIITAGDADECRAIVFLDGEAVTYTDGAWPLVRGKLQRAGLCLVDNDSAAPIPDGSRPSVVSARRQGPPVSEEPVKRDVV